MHEGRLVEEREHAVEILKVVFQKGEGFVLWRKWLEDGASEYIAKDLGLPVGPFVVISRHF
jgi:hypothetical protein